MLLMDLQRGGVSGKGPAPPTENGLCWVCLCFFVFDPPLLSGCHEISALPLGEEPVMETMHTQE